MTARHWIPLTALACLLVPGCVTPQPVKDASAAQVQLIDSLDAATASLHHALEQYSDDKRQLINNEARIVVARMAIYSALADEQARDKAVDFDTVFNLSNTAVRPYVDHSMRAAADLEAPIKRVEQLIAAIPVSDDTMAYRAALGTELDDLREQQALLANKPKYVLAVESVIRDDLEDLEATQANLREAISVLRAQFATMKGAATAVNLWLGIDVTVTQEQTDSLTKTYSELIKELNAPEPTTNPGTN
jgi:hypothetical protein